MPTCKALTAWKVFVIEVILVRILPHSLRTSPNSVRIWENADQNNSEYGHFLRSEHRLRAYHFRLIFPYHAYNAEAALRMCSKNNILWKYPSSLQENTKSKCDFNEVAKQLYDEMMGKLELNGWTLWTM